MPMRVAALPPAVGDPELLEAFEEVEASESPSCSSMQRYLAKVRELRLRDPERVARMGAELLRSHPRRLSQDEVWALHEQVAVAALDVGHADLAQCLVQSVHRRFPDSARASRLTGLVFEAAGEWAQAEALYTKELERDPQNVTILKRRIGMLRAKGDLGAAGEALKSYLDLHASDTGAWEEAAELYTGLGLLPQAAFAWEEVLLQAPASLAAMLALADTLYSGGGAPNWRAARGYYAGVLEQTRGDSVRALYGVCACAAQLGSGGGGKGRSNGGEDDGDLPRLAGEALLQRYALRCPAKLPLVKAMLRSQGLL